MSDALIINGSNEFVPDFDSLLPGGAGQDSSLKIAKSKAKRVKKALTPPPETDPPENNEPMAQLTETTDLQPDQPPAAKPKAKRVKSVKVDKADKLDDEPIPDLMSLLPDSDRAELEGRLNLLDDINIVSARPVKPKRAAAKRVAKPTLSADGKPIKVDADRSAEDEKHQNLLLILHRYSINERFAGYLKEHGFDLKKMHLQKKSSADLEELINRVRLTVNSKHENGFVDGLIEGAVQGSETMITVASRGRVNLQGLKNELYQNSEFLDLVEQLKLEHLSFIKVDPKIRLLMIIMQTAMRVAAINKISQGMHSNEPPAEPQQQTANPHDIQNS